jgi:hypothetical protein
MVLKFPFFTSRWYCSVGFGMSSCDNHVLAVQPVQLRQSQRIAVTELGQIASM